jgi:hypothetical protein
MIGPLGALAVGQNPLKLRRLKRAKQQPMLQAGGSRRDARIDSEQLLTLACSPSFHASSYMQEFNLYRCWQSGRFSNFSAMLPPTGLTLLVGIALKRCAALNSKLGTALERVHLCRDGCMTYRLRIAEIANLNALCGMYIIRHDANSTLVKAPRGVGALRHNRSRFKND